MDNDKQRKTFLSYSRANKDFAIKLAKELKAEGFYVWLDQLDIPAGSRWDREVEKALEECEIFMIILTKASINSENVLDEIGYAVDNGKRFLPVMLEICNVPLRLRRFQYVDFTTKNFDDGVESAKELLRSLVAQTTIPRVEVSAVAQDQSAQVEEDRKAKEEAERIVSQKAKDERVAQGGEADRLWETQKAERAVKAEAERLVQANTETERKAKEEVDRLAAQKAEADRLAKQRAEAERLAKAKAETERKAKEEADRLTAQKAKADQNNIFSDNAEQTSDGTKSRKTINDRLQIWWSRGLIVAVVMAVLGFILNPYYSIETIVFFLIVFGVFGFMFYPHKTAYILTVVFSVIGYLFIHDLYLGVGLGFILTSIISRILHAMKKI